MEVSQDEANYLITEYLRYWNLEHKDHYPRKVFRGSEEEILEDIVSAGNYVTGI